LNTAGVGLVDEDALRAAIGKVAVGKLAKAQNWTERTRLRRLTVAVLVMVGSSVLLAAPTAAATSHGRQITDSKYSISFHIPSTWKHPVVKRPTSGTTKVSVEDVSGSIGLGLVQVQVIAGHKTDASEIATGLLEAAPGAAILGSSVAKFQFGDAVQLRFSLGTSAGAVYGIVDAFYLHARTYIVAFDAADPSINAKARAAVMGSWGT
jgi:hypothetical protein